MSRRHKRMSLSASFDGRLIDFGSQFAIVPSKFGDALNAMQVPQRSSSLQSVRGMVFVACYIAGLVLPGTKRLEAAQKESGVQAEEVRPLAPDNELVKFVLTGIRSAHDQLRSGAFRVVDTTFQSKAPDVGPDEEDLTQELRVYYAFDRVRDLLRYDERHVHGPLAALHGVRYIYTGDRCYYRLLDNVEIYVYPRNDVPVFDMRPFEVQQIGLGNVFEFRDRLAFDSLCDRFSNTFTSVKQPANEDKTVDLLFLAPKAKANFMLRVDPKKSYLPVLLEMRYDGSEQPFAVTETQWEFRDDVWVPISMICNYRQPNGITRRKLSFEWESINRLLDDNLFSKEAMDIKKGNLFVDYTVNPAKPVIQRPDRAEGANVRENLGATNGKTPPSRHVWILTLNGIAILILGCIVLWRRRVNQSKTLPK